MKRRRWCGDIDNGGGDWQGGGTAAFVVVQQQLVLNLWLTLMSMNRLITNYGTVYSSNG